MNATTGTARGAVTPLNRRDETLYRTGRPR